MSCIIEHLMSSRACRVWALGVSDMIDVRPGQNLRGLPISNINFRISGLPDTASRVARLLLASASSARLHCLCCSCLCLFVVVPCLLPIALRYKVEAVVTAPFFWVCVLRADGGWGITRAWVQIQASMAPLCLFHIGQSIFAPRPCRKLRPIPQVRMHAP